MKNKKVIILGGGPCGLTAAWELARNGVDVTVIEKESSIGGLCKTTRQGGYQFDLGGHRFISKDTSLIQDVRDIMGRRLISSKRVSIIKTGGKEIRYPIHWKNIFSNYGFATNINFLAGYISSSLGLAKSKAPDGSFEKWVDLRFGKPLNRVFFKPYTEKLWGIKASALSDDWAAQRISLLSVLDLLLRAAGLKKTPSRSCASTFLYPLGGIGEIFEVMADRIRCLGGKIITSCEIKGAEVSRKRVTGIRVKVDNTKSILRADQYLSTIPLNSIAPLLGIFDAPGLTYRSLRFLNIKLARENFSPNTWIYVPERDLKMTRIQEPKRRSPESAPPGKSSLILEIPCNMGDSIWEMREEALFKIALKDMTTLGFDISDEVEGYFSTFEEYAYPCYELGYKERVNELIDKISLFENLDTLGRQGLFRYIFMDTAMLMGREWARSVVSMEKSPHIQEMDNAQVLLEGQSVA